MSSDYVIQAMQEQDDLALEEASLQRYADCLGALRDAVMCGVGIKSLQTMKFEMAINNQDFIDVLEDQMKAKFKLMNKQETE